jgi:WD40 repeat protein
LNPAENARALQVGPRFFLGSVHWTKDTIAIPTYRALSTIQGGEISSGEHLWHPVSGQELLTLEGRPCQVNTLSFSPDGRSLAVCWHDGAVRLFRAR